MSVSRGRVRDPGPGRVRHRHHQAPGVGEAAGPNWCVARSAAESAFATCCSRLRCTGIGADGRSDSTAKVDWTLNTHALDAVLSGECQLTQGGASPMRRWSWSAATLPTTRTHNAQPACLLPPGLHRHHAKADEPQPAKRRKRDKRGRGDAGSDSEDDVPAPAPAAAPPARGRPQGRYAKRESGKMVTCTCPPGSVLHGRQPLTPLLRSCSPQRTRTRT